MMESEERVRPEVLAPPNPRLRNYQPAQPALSWAERQTRDEVLADFDRRAREYREAQARHEQQATAPRGWWWWRG